MSGTVSATNGSNVVTGVGTTFTNLAPGYFINLDKNIYEISSITNDTSLILLKTFYGRSFTNLGYRAMPMNTGIYISSITIMGSSVTGLYLRSIHSSNITDVTMCTSGLGTHLLGCSMMSLSNFRAANSPSHAITIESCQSISFIGGTAYNNGGDGYRIVADDTDVTFNGISSSNNSGHGITIIGTANGITMNSCTFRNNNSKGINLGGGTKNIIIDGSLVSGNASDGGYFAGDSNVISNNIFKSNGDAGILIPAIGDDSVISGNICENNGIFIASNKSTVIGNRCKSNGNAGCLIVAGSVKTTIKGNMFEDNTGANLTDNGTGTIKDM